MIGAQEEKIIIRRFLAKSTAESVIRLKRKLTEIATKEKDINFDYELLVETCNNMCDILNNISNIDKPKENTTNVQINTDSDEESVTKTIKKMKLSDNVTYI